MRDGEVGGLAERGMSRNASVEGGKAASVRVNVMRCLGQRMYSVVMYRMPDYRHPRMRMSDLHIADADVRLLHLADVDADANVRFYILVDADVELYMNLKI